MKLSIGSFAIRRRPLLTRLQAAKAPIEAGPRESVKKILADLRTNYQARKKTKAPMEKKRRQFSIGYFLLVFFIMLMIQNYYGSRHLEIISYSQFKSLVKKGLVNDLAIGETIIQGSMKGAGVKEIFTPEKVKNFSPEVIEGKKLLPFETVRVEDPGLTAELEAARVQFTGEVTSTWLPTLLSWVVPVALFFLLWSYIGKKMGAASSGLMQIGKSKAKVYIEKKTGVTFADVAGIDEAEEEVAEVVGFLKDPDKYQRLGGRIPKGVLIVGPPGTGKTLLARAVAGEAGVPFFSISGSEFVEMFVGVGAARVRDLFDQARRQAPCIIFIDELDALGRARNAQPFTGGMDEKEQTLNQLLVELDGFDSSTGIVLLAATNRPEILDPALLRAGRFDRQVLVDRPDRTGRTAILKVHAKNVALTTELDLESVAALTPGFTGADLANLVNEAAIVATRRGAEAVALEDFTAAIERIVAGLEKKSRILNPREREVVAYHEMGHALVALMSKQCDPVHKVSIIPRGVGALGYTMQRPTEDRFLMTSEELQEKMSVLLGGRAAEQLVFDHLSTGAADDLAKVTDIARSMVTRYGMVPELGHVSYESQSSAFLGEGAAAFRTRDYSDDTAREIDTAVRAIVQNAFDNALAILDEERDALEKGARQLLEKETLAEAELQALYDEIEQKHSRPPRE